MKNEKKKKKNPRREKHGTGPGHLAPPTGIGRQIGLAICHHRLQRREMWASPVSLVSLYVLLDFFSLCQFFFACFWTFLLRFQCFLFLFYTFYCFLFIFHFSSFCFFFFAFSSRLYFLFDFKNTLTVFLNVQAHFDIHGHY